MVICEVESSHLKTSVVRSKTSFGFRADSVALFFYRGCFMYVFKSVSHTIMPLQTTNNQQLTHSRSRENSGPFLCRFSGTGRGHMPEDHRTLKLQEGCLQAVCSNINNLSTLEDWAILFRWLKSIHLPALPAGARWFQ